MRTKRKIWTLLVFLSCSLITACGVPESVHPLSPPEEAVPDSRLQGAWVGIDPDGTEDELLHLYVQAAKSGLMDVLLVGLDDEELWTLRFEAHITPMGNRRYVNLRSKAFAVPEDEDGGTDVKGSDWWIADRYMFAEYTLSGDGLLRVWILVDSETLHDAIQSGELKGEISGDTLITDEPEWIVRFLEVHDPGENFDGPRIFRRSDAVAVPSQ